MNGSATSWIVRIVATVVSIDSLVEEIDKPAVDDGRFGEVKAASANELRYGKRRAGTTTLFTNDEANFASGEANRRETFVLTQLMGVQRDRNRSSATMAMADMLLRLLRRFLLQG